MPLNGKRLSAEEALHLILETTDQDSDSELSDVDILTVDPPAPTATKVTEPEPEYCTFISSESDFHELKPALKPAVMDEDMLHLSHRTHHLLLHHNHHQSSLRRKRVETVENI